MSGASLRVISPLLCIIMMERERRLRERGTEVYTDNQTEIDRYWYVPSQTAGSLN